MSRYPVETSRSGGVTEAGRRAGLAKRLTRHTSARQARFFQYPGRRFRWATATMTISLDLMRYTTW
jgi:hypothetical protein